MQCIELYIYIYILGEINWKLKLKSNNFKLYRVLIFMFYCLFILDLKY